jgi:hypothetical protein
MSIPLPLVSCIVPLAVDCFLRQGCPSREPIVDDGSDPVGDLVPADQHLSAVVEREYRKLNALCPLPRPGAES